VEVSFTRSLDRIDRVQWERLAEGAGHIFATAEWLLTWWRHYGKDSPLVCVARAGTNLLAVVPMYEWWTHGLAVLRFIGHGVSDQLGPICAPEAESHVTGAFAQAIAAVPLRRFVLIAEQVGAAQRFGNVTGARLLYREANPVLHFDCDSWEEFLKGRTRNFRSQVHRFPRMLSELGQLSYRLTSDPEHLERDLDTLFRLHEKRWGTDTTPFTRARPFHIEFAAQALHRGWLRLWFLEIDGRPVAALYGFRFAGAESVYQSGRDLAFQDQPLGFVLQAHAVREALKDGMREYRLGRGDEAYKRRFATSDPGLETYGLPRGSSARLLLAGATAVGGRSLGLRRILDRLKPHVF
jgi:CelD/BcsL family acetyltransferase involved in cellulose biosynthesis